MTATKKHTAPPWWGLFIENVRRTGLVFESLEATRWQGKTLNRKAHVYHTRISEELRLELELAIKEGTAASKLARVNAVLEPMKTGTPLSDALRAAEETPSRFYVLLEETGTKELYDEITDYWYRKRKGYEEAIVYADERLADEARHYGDDPYIALLREVLAACNKPSVALAKAPSVALRDTIIRIIGGEFKGEADCPPFLQEDVSGEDLGREGKSDNQGV